MLCATRAHIITLRGATDQLYTDVADAVLAQIRFDYEYIRYVHQPHNPNDTFGLLHASSRSLARLRIRITQQRMVFGCTAADDAGRRHVFGARVQFTMLISDANSSARAHFSCASQWQTWCHRLYVCAHAHATTRVAQMTQPAVLPGTSRHLMAHLNAFTRPGMCFTSQAYLVLFRQAISNVTPADARCDGINCRDRESSTHNLRTCTKSFSTRSRDVFVG